MRMMNRIHRYINGNKVALSDAGYDDVITESMQSL